MGCVAVVLFIQLANTKLTKKDPTNHLLYEVPPPNGGVGNTAWWQNQQDGRHKKMLPSMRHKLFHNPRSPPPVFSTWRETAVAGCEGNLVAYGNEFVQLRHVVLDRKFLLGREGGEEIKSVINQSEQAEYHQCSYGCFQLACRKRPEYYFNHGENHVTLWFDGLRTIVRRPKHVDETRNQFTIMIVRYEYANIYHTLTDFYNAFILMQFFNQTQHNTNILIVDGHPQGQLDPIWGTLFNSSTRVSSLKTRVHFSNAAWGILGYNSPIFLQDVDPPPLFEEFRHFFLSSYHMTDNHKLDCQHLSILFIWRHNYLAHPRNPQGVVSRKIANERELLNFTKATYPKFQVRGVQIDLFKFKHQLQLVTNTDILIGMHGAGLTHTVFLPKHATLVEMIPSYWSYNAHGHFMSLAKWRHLHYISWENDNEANEVADSYTNIPTDMLHKLIEGAITKMCVTHQNANSDSVKNKLSQTTKHPVFS